MFQRCDTEAHKSKIFTVWPFTEQVCCVEAVRRMCNRLAKRNVVVACTTAVGGSTDVGRWTDLGQALREGLTESANELNMVWDRGEERNQIILG